jgi:hypothetical protein
MRHKEWAAVFNVKDIFTPPPPGLNRFEYIWALITFRAPITLWWIYHNIIPLGEWNINNYYLQIWVTQATQYLESNPKNLAIVVYHPKNLPPIQ